MLCLDGCVACAQEIDLAKPASNRNKTAGFFDAEREGFKKVWPSDLIAIHSLVVACRVTADAC